MNVRSRYKTREPVEVVQQLESCHHESVTDFPLIEKSVFPEKYSDFRSKKGKNHPLKKAKSHNSQLQLSEVLTLSGALGDAIGYNTIGLVSTETTPLWTGDLVTSSHKGSAFQEMMTDPATDLNFTDYGFQLGDGQLAGQIVNASVGVDVLASLGSSPIPNAESLFGITLPYTIRQVELLITTTLTQSITHPIMPITGSSWSITTLPIIPVIGGRGLLPPFSFNPASVNGFAQAIPVSNVPKIGSPGPFFANWNDYFNWLKWIKKLADNLPPKLGQLHILTLAALQDVLQQRLKWYGQDLDSLFAALAVAKVADNKKEVDRLEKELHVVLDEGLAVAKDLQTVKAAIQYLKDNPELEDDET